MDYDLEREKRKTEDVRKAMRELFPLVDEDLLPWAISQVPSFLRERIKFEIKEQNTAGTKQIARVLCEVVEPKTWLIDMVRLAVDQAKECPRLKERVKSLESQLLEAKATIERLHAELEGIKDEEAGRETDLAMPADLLDSL